MRRIAVLAVSIAAALCLGALDGSPARVASAGPDSVPPRTGGWIGEVKKVHNVDVGGGKFALQLTAPVETWSMKGRTVAVVVFFHDTLGNAIPSSLPGYADAQGQIRLTSQDVKLSSDREGMDFVFRLPYEAFPRRSPGRYEVEGRLRLVERTAAGRELLATASVRFFVEG